MACDQFENPKVVMRIVQMHKFQTLSIFFASNLKYTPLVWSNITEVYGQTYTLKPNDRMLIMLMERPFYF